MRPLSLFIAMLLLGLLDCRCSQAQNDTMVFFNKTYPNEYVSNGSGITTFCIENMPDGYLLAGSRLSGTADGSITLADIDNIKDHIYLHKIDLHGNTLWKKDIVTTQFADTTVGLPTSSNVLLRKQNGDFLLTYRYTFGDDNKLTELACVDKDGNMLWKKQYPEIQKLYVNYIGEQTDGYILYGNIYDEVTTKGILMKTDTLGNILWQQRYGEDAEHTQITECFKSPDGGFIMGGQVIRGEQPITITSDKTYLTLFIKTDSLGNIQWQREVGLLGYFSGGGQVFPYTDSTFLAHATTTRPWEDDPNYYDYQFYFAEYRYNNPEPLWEIRNDVPDKGSLYTASPKLIRLNDGNFLGKFHEDDETVFPLLMKLDSSTFEVLWQKGMTLDSTAQNYWYDIEKTPDNGIIVCGFQYSSPQTSWVVKFDQHGNTCALGTDSTYLYPCLWQQQDYGDACDDHNPVTYNDTVLSDCTCVGEYECPDLQNSIGFACDDGNPLTYDDIVTDTCTCIGTPYECANLLLNIGDNCDDGNPLTYKDKVTENCECIGKFYSCPDLLSNIGYACDDGNPNTIMDHLSDSCVCIGYCPELFTYTSFSCNDGNPSTINDIVSFDCICGGQVVGINEINDGSIFNISPNPAQDRISIEWRGAPPTVAYIYNIKQQLQSRITLQSGSNSLDVSGWQSGLYFVKAEGGTATKFSIVR